MAKETRTLAFDLEPALVDGVKGAVAWIQQHADISYTKRRFAEEALRAHLEALRKRYAKALGGKDFPPGGQIRMGPPPRRPKNA